MRAAIWLRAGLALLTLVQVVVGLAALLLPSYFFAIPVVNLGMAYNEHLMQDYGALTLATAVVLGASVRTPRLARLALVMYLVWAVAHFFIHLRMLHHVTPGQAVFLMVALGAVVLIAAGLFALASRMERSRRREEPHADTGADPPARA